MDHVLASGYAWRLPEYAQWVLSFITTIQLHLQETLLGDWLLSPWWAPLVALLLGLAVFCQQLCVFAFVLDSWVTERYLVSRGVLPRRPEVFLRHSAAIGLLQRVGGQYRFAHQEFQRFFASSGNSLP